MLIVEELSKSFDGFRAVNKANLEVRQGEIIAVIGPNGAGKTTLFNLITGVVKPDGGRVIFKGEDITGSLPHEVCRRGISRSFQVVNLFQKLTVFENIQVSILAREKRTWNLFASSSKLVRQETEEILNRAGLKGKGNVVAALLSHGDRKVLEIAMALGGNPHFLILDEPTAGMAQDEGERCIDLLRRLSREMGPTIVFCEHDMEMVFGIADRIMVMVRGTTVAQDCCDAIRCNRIVQEAYLGGSNHA